MRPIGFRESNRVLRGPADARPDPVGRIEPLPTWTDGAMSVSCWRPSLRERLSVAVFGRVWLAVLSGRTQPAVSLTGTRTYFEERK